MLLHVECLGRGCLILTAVDNLSRKLWATAKYESVSLFYKYFGKVKGFLLMPRPDSFCTDAAEVPSEVRA